jgi:hypothetical protein
VHALRPLLSPKHRIPASHRLLLRAFCAATSTGGGHDPHNARQRDRAKQ